MGRYSLTAESPSEEEDRIERYNPPNDNVSAEPCLNPIHVYYNFELPKQQRRISIWWWVVIVVIVAHVIARYGPPAPPPSQEHSSTLLSWQEFFDKEGTRLVKSLIALASVVPHVWHWCLQGIRQEMQQVYDEWTRLPPCPMQPATVQNDEHWEIVGQPKAVSIISDALDAWDRESSLFLLFAGTVGVGKLELAKQVAQRIYGDCALRAMLVLDFNVDNADLVSTTISSLIQRQDEHGAVIILRHVEAFTARQIVHLCQLISQQDGVVFIGITGIGTRSIHQNLKQYGAMERIPRVELETTIRDEVDEYFVEDVAKHVHAIAPFVPIGQVELQEILQLHVDRLGRRQAGKQWKSLSMTNELAAALVDPTRIEYIEWKDKTTGETILVFSGTGAEVLEIGSPVMTKVAAQIKRCLSDPAPERSAQLHYDHKTTAGIVRWCVGTSCWESCRFPLD